MSAQPYDRTGEDLGNIIALEQVNLPHANRQHATRPYLVGLGLTRNPFTMVGLENKWLNAGRSQFHLPTRGKQLLRGRIGLVIPDHEALMKRLDRVAKPLAGTQFTFAQGPGYIDATCPWGNRFRAPPPGPEFGPVTLG